MAPSKRILIVWEAKLLSPDKPKRPSVTSNTCYHSAQGDPKGCLLHFSRFSSQIGPWSRKLVPDDRKPRGSPNLMPSSQLGDCTINYYLFLTSSVSPTPLPFSAKAINILKSSLVKGKSKLPSHLLTLDEFLDRMACIPWLYLSSSLYPLITLIQLLQLPLCHSATTNPQVTSHLATPVLKAFALVILTSKCAPSLTCCIRQ